MSPIHYVLTTILSCVAFAIGMHARGIYATSRFSTLGAQPLSWACSSMLNGDTASRAHLSRLIVMSHFHETICTTCYYERVPPLRAKLQAKNKERPTCLSCGEKASKKVKHTVVPMPKSNYILVTDMSLLVGLNSSHKGGGKL